MNAPAWAVSSGTYSHLKLALLAYVALFAAYTLLAPGESEGRKLAMNLGQMVAPTFAAILCWLASRRAAPRGEAWSWSFFSLANAAWAGAQALWTYYEVIEGIDVPTPSSADAIWVAEYPLLFAALMLQVPRQGAGLGRLTSALDALIFTLGAAGLSWHFVVAPAFGGGVDPMLALVNVFYPLGDLLIILGLISLVLRWPLERVPVTVLYLLAAMLAEITVDTLYTMLLLEDSYQTGSPVDVLWPLPPVLTGLAAISRLGAPGSGTPTQEPTDTLNLSWTHRVRVLLPYAALPAAGFLIYVSHPGGLDGLLEEGRLGLGAALGVIVLVMLRQLLTVVENERLNRSLIALSRDLEARVAQRTEALQESEARYRRIADNMRDMVSQTDTRGMLQYVSPSHRAILGYEPDGLVGRPFSDFVHPEDIDRVMAAFNSGLETRSPGGAQLRYRHASGRYVWAESVGSPLFDDEGNVAGAIFSSRDITERKHLEAQLLRAQRLEIAGRVAGQVAHDFNNLLTPLAAYPELIKMALPQGHPALRFCDPMLEAVEQMAEINSDMLTLGRRGRLDSEPVDLNGLVLQATEQIVDPPSTLTVELDLAADLAPADGAPAQLLRVITNLVANAREAMRDAGVLGIKTENVGLDAPLDRRPQVGIGRYVRLSVSDTGCGIPPDVRERIFDTFFTTKRTGKRPGSGLGLSIVQAIVEDHKGYIDLETEVGRGTTFLVYLPASHEALRSTAEEPLRGGTESVLVVDDDQSQRNAAREILTTLGYRVETMGSAEQAVEYLRRRPADLLILDMIMPGGMDGAETYRRVLEVRPGQRAIIVSGFAETERVRAAQALGASEFVRKPMTLERLARAVRRALDARPG